MVNTDKPEFEPPTTREAEDAIIHKAVSGMRMAVILVDPAERLAHLQKLAELRKWLRSQNP